VGRPNFTGAGELVSLKAGRFNLEGRKGIRKELKVGASTN